MAEAGSTRRKEPARRPSARVASGRYSDRRELWQWGVRGTGLGLGLLLVVVLAVVAQAATNVIILVTVALLLASALDPLVNMVRERWSIPRPAIILTVYVLLVVLAAVLAVLIVPAALDEVSDLVERLPQIIEGGRAWAEGLEPAILGTVLVRLIETVERTLMAPEVPTPDPETVVQYGLSVADAVIGIVTVLTLVFFWLVSRETIQRFALAMLPMHDRRPVRQTWNQVEGRMGYWVRGQLTLMLVVGTLTTIAYFVLGLDNPLLLGLIAGIAEIIPIVGPALGAIPALISAFVGGGPELALLVAGVYVVIQVLEGNVLVPLVMKNAVGLPPFVVIISLLVGAAVAGLAGALLAVPVAAGAAIILEHGQARRRTVALETPEIADADEDEDEDEDEHEGRERGVGV